MPKSPTFKESWLTGEIPDHPTLGNALYNAVLRAREVLAGQQEKTIRKLWDILNTVLEHHRSQEPTPSDVQGLLFASVFREGGSYQTFFWLRVKGDPDIKRILDKVPEQKILAVFVLAEVDRGHVHAAIEAASELDPIQEKIPAYLSSDDTDRPYIDTDRAYILRNIEAEVLELEKQTKKKTAKQMGREGGLSGKRGEGPVRHAIRRVSEKIGSRVPNKVLRAFLNKKVMVDLEESLSDPVHLKVLEVEWETPKKWIHYRLRDGTEGKLTYHTLQTYLSDINKTR